MTNRNMIAEYNNAENGLRASLYEQGGKFLVQVLDTDCLLYVDLGTTFNNLESAKAYAIRCAN